MKKAIVVIVMLILIGGILYLAPNYEIGERYAQDEIRVILDGREITKKIPQKAIIKENVVFLSQDTVDIYFDKYLFYDEAAQTFITTSDTKVGKMKLGENVVKIDHDTKEVEMPIEIVEMEQYVQFGKLTQEDKESFVKVIDGIECVPLKGDNTLFFKGKDGDKYIPISKLNNLYSIKSMVKEINKVKYISPRELREDYEVQIYRKQLEPIKYIPIDAFKEVYNIDVVYREKVIITKKDTLKTTGTLKEDAKLRKFKEEYCRTITMLEKEEVVDIYRIEDNWVYARTENGFLGYIKQSELEIQNPEILTKKEEEIPEKKAPINLVWEYAENYTPNRSNEDKKIGLNVVSPTWFYIKNTQGDITSKVSTSYISWAKSNNYEVWAVLKNDFINITETSEFMNRIESRENLIKQITDYAVQYQLDGINIDFENMKQEDAGVFSQFVRELAAYLRKNNITVSVDVTVPDGSPTWSLCYNRAELNDAVDYVILMAYDQYSASSPVPGPVASLAWVETNIKKMLKNEGVAKEKLILGIPFYSRAWTVKDGVVKSTSPSMEGAYNYLSKEKYTKEWIEEDGQYYLEATTGTTKEMIWLEEEKSVAKKVELVNRYDLAGVAAWRRGFETNIIWQVIHNTLNSSHN